MKWLVFSITPLPLPRRCEENEMIPLTLPSPARGEGKNIGRKEIPSPLRGEGLGGGDNEILSHLLGFQREGRMRGGYSYFLYNVSNK